MCIKLPTINGLHQFPVVQTKTSSDYSLLSSDETKKSGRRLLGDVHFEEARKKASWITPVPGGGYILPMQDFFT